MRIHHVFLQHVMFVHNLTSTSIYFIRPNPAFCSVLVCAAVTIVKFRDLKF